MLFISRFMDLASYGVVDTDDGVEEKVSHQRLIDVINEYGMLIGGVSIDDQRFSILPYQDPDTFTKLQVKTHLVSGVSIKTYKDMVTHIDLSDCRGSIGSIRLSDFGKSCADGIFLGNKSKCSRCVTVILDDIIKLTDLSFMQPEPFTPLGVPGMGAMFDLREVTRISHLLDIYWQLLVERFMPLNVAPNLDMLDSIIDDENRKEAIGDLLDEYIESSLADIKFVRKSPEFFKQRLQIEYKDWFKKIGISFGGV